MNQDHAPEKFQGEFSDNFEMEQICQDIFGDKTNRSAESKARQRELEELKDKIPPVDISSIALQDRAAYDEHRVTVPAAVRERLETLSFPVPEDLVAELEDMMMEHHRVEDPAWIMIDQDYKNTGKTWQRVPELEKLLTPFIYMHP